MASPVLLMYWGKRGRRYMGSHNHRPLFNLGSNPNLRSDRFKTHLICLFISWRHQHLLHHKNKTSLGGNYTQLFTMLDYNSAYCPISDG